MIDIATTMPSVQSQCAASPNITEIDHFYDWIYQRGIARLAARGTTPQQLSQHVHQEEQH
jgi:hypothetical protein